MAFNTLRMQEPAAALSARTRAPIHRPGDPGYDAARAAWNTAVDLEPVAVACPQSAQQVGEVVAAARSAGLRAAPQSTGHNAGPLAAGDLSDVVLLKTGAMRGVRIDADRRIARVEGGALWGDVTEPAGRVGLATLHGSSPDVGVSGYSLGGGVFLYARRLGMATSSLTAVELVLADGNLVRADHSENTDLFWALRGGGGSFGVVTALEFNLFEIPTVYAGRMLWDRRDTEKVARRWADWAPDAPEEVTTTLRVLNMPPLPELPPEVSGRELVCIDGAVLAGDERGRELLAGLRELRPEVDTFERVPAASLVRLHMDPEGPTPVVGDSRMLTGLPPDAVDTYVEQAGPDAPASVLTAELRQLGGAVSRPHPNGGALDCLEDPFLYFVADVPASPEEEARSEERVRAATTAMEPWSSPRRYLNFAETAVDPRVGYSAEAWERLTRIRAQIDPDGFFQANHAVPAG